MSRLQEHYLHPPSTKEYNVSMIASLEPESYSQFGQDLFLDKFVFKGQVKEGFFIEAGADDFVHHSNTLWFEMKYQWTGVLVEANPIRFPRGYGNIHIFTFSISLLDILQTERHGELLFAWQPNLGLIIVLSLRLLSKVACLGSYQSITRRTRC